MRRVPLALAATVLVAVSGCSADSTDSVGHSHEGGVNVSLPVGDGTVSERVGYSLHDVTLPEQAGVTGELSFHLENFRGETITDYVEELTKDLHLYVVDDDLTVFRHLHPTMADDGTWTVPVTLPAAGDYRVVTEFVAVDDGGNGDHLILGESVTVPEGTEGDEVEPDPVVQVEVTEPPEVSPNGRMSLRVRDALDRPVRLETYLGTYGHVTGFHRESGALLHMHPLSAPEVTEAGSALEFHTEITEPGDYRLFVQVRIDGFIHTVPVDVGIGAPAA